MAALRVQRSCSCLCGTKTEQPGPGPSEILVARSRATGFKAISPGCIKSFAHGTSRPAVFGPTTNATGFPRPPGSKGKCSAHQAVTKHLTNNSLCCSDSSNGSYLLGLGVLSHGIISVGLPRSCVPVHSSPYYKQGLYRSNSRHRRLNRHCSLNHSTYTRREVPARTRSSRARFGYCSSARKVVPPGQIHFEPPGGAGGE
jgi:hypothetical protein